MTLCKIITDQTYIDALRVATRLKRAYVLRIEDKKNGRQEYVGPFKYDTLFWTEDGRFRIRVKAGRSVG